MFVEYEGIFTAEFEDSDLSSLVWIPEYRKTIEPEIGDAYGYGLQLSRAKVTFSQTVENTSPLSNKQRLSFVFGKQKHPLNPAAYFSSYYASIFVTFSSGPFGDVDGHWVHLDSRNMGIIKYADFGSKSLNPGGEALIKDLFRNKDKLIQVRGLTDKDLETLVTLLDRIQTKYKEGRLSVF
ncbi:hypothetical protein AYK26_00020 [Euryarchaeota archaeon SM23-78]|nr:MAG: hypothetical protein AYK26_00020 [Euryarchaeota archaeon SM23-78]MBW3001509.1 hypothetical protein [Candidatus Woesearchaeota archaeon]